MFNDMLSRLAVLDSKFKYLLVGVFALVVVGGLVFYFCGGSSPIGDMGIVIGSPSGHEGFNNVTKFKLTIPMGTTGLHYSSNNKFFVTYSDPNTNDFFAISSYDNKRFNELVNESVISVTRSYSEYGYDSFVFSSDVEVVYTVSYNRTESDGHGYFECNVRSIKPVQV